MIDQAGILMAQGKRIACERIQGVNDNMVKSHYHEYFELYFLETGERIHMMQDEMYKISPGEFLIFPPYIMHRSFGDENMPFKRIVLYFEKGEIISEELCSRIESGLGVYSPDKTACLQIHRLLETILKEEDEPDAFSEEFMHTQLNILLLLIARTLKRPERVEKRDRIGDVIHYIHTNFAKEITLEQLSHEFYISPYYLCREFKKHTNSTIIQYLNVTRIMNAQRRLMETEAKITEISKEMGFSNITHFNRVFKSVTGMSPSGFRKQLKESADRK